MYILGIFASMFTSNIGPWIFFLIVSLSDFGVRNILSL